MQSRKSSALAQRAKLTPKQKAAVSAEKDPSARKALLARFQAQDAQPRPAAKNAQPKSAGGAKRQSPPVLRAARPSRAAVSGLKVADLASLDYKLLYAKHGMPVDMLPPTPVHLGPMITPSAFAAAGTAAVTYALAPGRSVLICTRPNSCVAPIVAFSDEDAATYIGDPTRNLHLTSDVSLYDIKPADGNIFMPKSGRGFSCSWAEGAHPAVAFGDAPSNGLFTPGTANRDADTSFTNYFTTTSDPAQVQFMAGFVDVEVSCSQTAAATVRKLCYAESAAILHGEHILRGGQASTSAGTTVGAAAHGQLNLTHRDQSSANPLVRDFINTHASAEILDGGGNMSSKKYRVVCTPRLGYSKIGELALAATTDSLTNNATYGFCASSITEAVLGGCMLIANTGGAGNVTLLVQGKFAYSVVSPTGVEGALARFISAQMSNIGIRSVIPRGLPASTANPVGKIDKTAVVHPNSATHNLIEGAEVGAGMAIAGKVVEKPQVLRGLMEKLEAGGGRIINGAIGYAEKGAAAAIERLPMLVGA